ncbi:MAG: MFS transporter [Acidimicrobiia bacterium]|nr:MFS transporter [Acidimicrobiia bacterium]
MTTGVARSFWRPTLSSTTALVIVSLPTFLLGAFGPTVKSELGISDTQLGALFTFGFLVSATVMQISGGWADRRGPRFVLRSALIVGTVGSLLFATVAVSFAVALVAMAVVRTAEAIGQPATNTLISQAIAPERRGFAMGLKQSAIPVSTAVAGLAVPILGSTIGWHGAFSLVAILAVPAWLVVPDVAAPNPLAKPARRQLWSQPHLRFAALGASMMAASVVTVSGFLAVAAVDAGYTEASAGLLLTLGGTIMIPGRIGWGIIADRFDFNRFRVVATSFAIGTTGFLLLASTGTVAIVVGTVLLYGLAWTWPGLLLLGVVEQHGDEPGAATAILQTGVRLGATGSPLLFGFLADRYGFSSAWFFPLTTALIGVALMLRAAHEIARGR